MDSGENHEASSAHQNETTAGLRTSDDNKRQEGRDSEVLQINVGSPIARDISQDFFSLRPECRVVDQAFQAAESALRTWGMKFSLFDSEKAVYSFQRLKDSMEQLSVEMQKNTRHVRTLEEDAETKNKVIIGLNDNIQKITRQWELLQKKYRQLKATLRSKRDPNPRPNNHNTSMDPKELMHKHSLLVLQLQDLGACFGVRPGTSEKEVIFDCKTALNSLVADKKRQEQTRARLQATLEQQTKELETKARTWSDVMSKAEQMAQISKEMKTQHEETKRRLSQTEYDCGQLRERCDQLEADKHKLANELAILRERRHQSKALAQDEGTREVVKAMDSIMKLFGASTIPSVLTTLRKVEQVVRSLPKLENFIKGVYQLIEKDSENRQQHLSHEAAHSIIQQLVTSDKEYNKLRNKLTELLCLAGATNDDIIKKVEEFVSGASEEVATDIGASRSATTT